MCTLEFFLCRQMPSVCITWQETNCAARSQVTPCAVLFSSPFFSFFHSGPYFIAPFGEEGRVFICQVPYCLSLGRGEAKIRYIRFWMGKLWFLEYIQSPWKLLGEKAEASVPCIILHLISNRLVSWKCIWIILNAPLIIRKEARSNKLEKCFPPFGSSPTQLSTTPL